MWTKILQLILNFIITSLSKRPTDDFNKPGPEPVLNETPSPEIPSEIVETDHHSVKVADIVNKLPWHKTRRWAKRELNTIRKIIVHQTAATSSLQEVNIYHITPSPNNHISTKGAPHICYHYAIDKDGIIYKVNYLNNTVWHCLGENADSIGILILGEFSGPSFNGKETPTEQQLNSLKSLLDAFTDTDLEEYTNGIVIKKSEIYGHRDFGKINCPGNVIYSFIQTYKNS